MTSDEIVKRLEEITVSVRKRESWYDAETAIVNLTADIKRARAPALTRGERIDRALDGEDRGRT